MSRNIQLGNHDEWWRSKKISAVYSIGVSSWWRLTALPEAPKAIRLGKRWTAWRASEVEEFMAKIASGVIRINDGDRAA